MEKNWKINPCDPQQQVLLSDALNIPPIIAQLLINRGISDAEEARQFLNADLSGLADPFLMKGMRETVDRLNKAKAGRERILVFGDYDVDGVTSSAIINKLFSIMDLDVIHHIPHRMDDGYGLNDKIVDFAVSEGVSLLVTVDCGMTAVSEVRTFMERGIDVVIIDHHEPSEQGVPNAVAIVNPKQEGCPYPFKEFASAGLVSKLTQAVLGSVDAVLDLAAIGTIADVVPLRGENRILVKAGLPKITQTKNVGLKALLRGAKIDDKVLSPFHIGFVLGPRINAAGRMDTALTALDLFLTEDAAEADKLSDELNRLNTTRQKMQRTVVDEAMSGLDADLTITDQKVIVLCKEGWHKGVLGIVASRITDRFYRPSIVISVKDGVGTASARSVAGFHLHEALEQCAECLENFGGHEGAAGLTIREENVDQFRVLINQVAESMLKPQVLTPTVRVDSEISIADIDLKLADAVDSMQPFGEGNAAPVFCSRNLQVKGRAMVLGRDTLKFWVTDGRSVISAVGFSMAKYYDLVTAAESVDLVYEISIDDWNKAPTPQLKLKDIKKSAPCAIKSTEYSN